VANFSVLFSKGNDEWPTPPDTFDALDRLFDFQLDACATAENAKCKKFFTKTDNGLLQDWGKVRVFCNAPNSQITKWVRKSWEASQAGALVVCLLPSRTDTNWFHNYIQYRAEIHFLHGRLRFGNAKTPAPFASMIVIYGRRDNRILRTCQHCRELFDARRIDAKTCSNACRQAAYTYRAKCKTEMT
jgi:phage N-6-adenine-methyltransferase